ncbi:MAG: acid--CoA ligase [Caulobacteraceae bacterium]|nr:acid--CoA ligase [Caulobacteraceae bacterium]
MATADLMEKPPAHPGERSFGWLLTYQAALDPDRPAITFEGETMTRGQLDKAANRMARALEALGVQEGDFVALVAPNSIAYHVFAFAIWKLGATPAPMPPKSPDLELRAMVDLAAPTLVIGLAPERVPGYRTIPADFQPDPSLSDAPPPDKITRYWKASTSGGSTGRPKIIVDAKPALTDPDVRFPILMIEREDVILHPAPLYHNAPFTQIHWTLCWGGHVIGMAKFGALQWLQLVERHKVRWAYLVPTMMSRIWALPEEVRNSFDLSSLRVAMHMAAPCPAWLKEAWIGWLGPERIWEVYGGTEAIGGSIINGVEWLEHRGSVGKINIPVKIADTAGETLPPGEIGEIFFKNPGGVGSTYVYRGAEARRSGEWESYGDMGYLDADNYLYLADRRTDMILSGGANIYPAEIEGALEAYPTIAAAVAVGLPDPDLGARIHVVMELRAGADQPTGKELELFLSDRIARSKLPYSYEFIDDALKDDAGKVRRSAIRDDRAARAAGGETFTPLRGA